MRIHQVKRKNAFVTIGATLFISWALLFCSGCPGDPNCCNTHYDTLVVSNAVFHSTNEMVDEGFDVVFTFEDWCSHDLTGFDACNQDTVDTRECRCAIKIDSLHVEGMDPDLWGKPLRIKLEVPAKPSLIWDSTFTVELDANQSYLILNKKIYEGSQMHIDYPQGFSDGGQVALTCGSLCITENIDTGDKKPGLSKQ